jgi:hypothetical protein
MGDRLTQPYARVARVPSRAHAAVVSVGGGAGGGFRCNIAKPRFVPCKCDFCVRCLNIRCSLNTAQARHARYATVPQ